MKSYRCYERRPTKVVAAAIVHGEKVYTLPKPNRHHNIIKHIADKEGSYRPTKAIQGFVDEHGNFLTRKEAAKIVIENGQLDKLRWPPHLFSEDLW